MTLNAYVHTSEDKCTDRGEHVPCVKKEQEMTKRQMPYWEFMRNGGQPTHIWNECDD